MTSPKKDNDATQPESGPKKQMSRRDFIGLCARCAGAAAVGTAALGLTLRADADRVWQLDPSTCTTCEGFRDANGWGRCASACVAPNSAVKAVNDFTVCGYCFICPAYFDVNSEQLEDGTYAGRICPTDAIIRRPVGEIDPYDPFNNFYEYTIDQEKCNGCGLCVLNCKPPMGNASLRLEIRHDRCLDCNSCNLAEQCPVDAFYRSPLDSDTPGYSKPGDKSESGGSHS